MTFHLAAYYRQLPSPGILTELQAIADPVIGTNPATNRLSVSSDLLIFAAYLGGVGATQGRVYTPWKLPNNIRPINTENVYLEVDGFAPIADWLNFPVRMARGHDIIFDASTVFSGVDFVGLLWLAEEQGLEPRPNGEAVTIRGTVTGPTPAALAWSEVDVSWEYDLPPGKYAIIGSDCVNESSVAHRWIVDSSNYRPGALTRTDLGFQVHPHQTNGLLGSWARFFAPVMPRLEVLCSPAVVSSFTVFLQVIRL